MPLTIIGSRFYMSKSPRDLYVGLSFDRPSQDGLPRGEPSAGDYTRELTRFVYSDSSAELSNVDSVRFQAISDWGVMSYVVVSQVPSGEVFGYQVMPPQVMSAGTVLEIDVGDLIIGTGVQVMTTSGGGGTPGEHYHTWAEVTGKPTVFPPSPEVLSLHQLVDVSTSGAINGQVLGFNGSTWGPVIGGGGAGANEVYIGPSQPIDPEVELWYDEDAVSSGGGGGSVAWADITGKPTTFAPTDHDTDHDDRFSQLSHTHAVHADSDHDDRFSLLAHTHTAPDWTVITGKPSTFTPTVQALDWLSDVATAGQAANLMLGYNGSSWVPLTGRWLQLTQASYDAIGTKDPNVLYVIVG